MVQAIKNPRTNRKKRVVVGGTFETLHAGHRALLKKAFDLGQVFIGLTSDKMAQRAKRRKIKSFLSRKKALRGLIKKEFKAKPEIRKIENKFGFTLKEDYDYIVVSPETYKTALLINKERRKKNRKPIKIFKIKFVLAKDGNTLSSTGILNGEI
ncbi:MAG: pantetheine-phosphate adenylyltransferase [bacterium]